jgi:N-acetylglucosamine-6-phosphate deacetylase
MVRSRLMLAPPRIAGTVLLPGGVLDRAVVHIAGGRLEGVEQGISRSTERALRRDGRGEFLTDHEVLAPAYIDVHCHGAGGGSASGGEASLRTMATKLLDHGVAGFVAALMTAPLADLLAAAGQAVRPADPQADREEVPRVATLLGLHFEGPALSPDWSAGHDTAALTSPLELSRSLASASEAWRSVRIVTFAPELEGGLQLVDDLGRAGIVASIGHTGASVDVAKSAYESGAKSTTHLFNGMPQLHHRVPGPVGAALAWAPFIELICDGLHIDARIMPSLARAIGDDRLVLVSDAVPLAGSRLRRVHVPGSSARIEAGRAVHPDGTLAGSRLLLDGMVANAVRSGVPLTSALRAATENPARLLVLRDRGTLTEGSIADLVVVSRAGRLRRVLTSGLTA